MNDRASDPRPGGTRYRAGEKRLYWIWWVIGPLVQILALWPLVRERIHVRALLVTSACFILMMFCLENTAIYWGWWIWNEQKLLGPKVGLVPLEEFLLYWVAAPSVIVLQALWLAFFQRRGKGTAPHA